MVKDKKTAIVGGVVGIVILLTIFCCEGNKEAVEVATEKTKNRSPEDKSEKNLKLKMKQL